MSRPSILLLLVKIFIICLFLGPLVGSALALGEFFELYSAPQGLAMGNAFTSDATGYASNYYNPAGLAKANRKQWEFIPIAAEGMLALGSAGRLLAANSFDVSPVLTRMQASPDKYYYHRANFIPAFSRRGMGFALLGSSMVAGRSDGSSVDLNATTDVVPTFGGAVNLAGNLVKIGFTGKLVMRQQIKGVYAHTDLADESAITSARKEGMAAGGDLGLMFTLPYKYLPTVGAVWKDIFDTKFFAKSKIFGATANGYPDAIPQSFNVGFSVHPHFGRTWKTTIAVEWKHLEKSLSWKKHLHIGVQLDNERSWFFWGGFNQLYWTAGMGLRLPGGNLELGSYGVDIGDETGREQDRRVFMRYTIGF